MSEPIAPPETASVLRVRYRLAAPDLEAARRLARRIALEQTVELPEACVPPHLLESAAGRVERVEPSGTGAFEARIAYPAWIAGDDLAQLFNLLFGNISLLDGILVEGVAWPEDLLRRHPGPGHGMTGLRRLAGAGPGRPLLASALKPVGLDAAALARLAGELAAGGVDLVKDDHGLADQAPAPFEERIPRCREAVERANAATGGSSRYVPNVTGPPHRLWRAVELARNEGCAGVLVAPLLVGLDTVETIARETGMAVLAHPALAGGLLRPGHGLAPELLLGHLFRMAGADGVIFPGPGGRFPFGHRVTAAIAHALRRPWNPYRAAAPVPAGGLDTARIPEMARAWGPDTVFLVGGSLHLDGDPRGAAARLRSALEEVSHDL